MKKIFLALFVLVSIGEIFSLVFQLSAVENFCKPLVLVTIGLYYYAYVERPGKDVLSAILFSCAGDTLLLFDSENSFFFIAGLSAFFVAHIFYILAYLRHQDASQEHALRGIQKIRFSFPIILAGTGLLIILYPFLGTLKVPVALYSLVLIIMVVNAIFRYGRTNGDSFWLVFGGSALFMVSDSILAIDKFYTPVLWSSVWIMITYITGQFLIIQGLCKHNFYYN